LFELEIELLSSSLFWAQSPGASIGNNLCRLVVMNQLRFGNPTTSGVRYRSKNAPQEYGSKHHSQQRVRRKASLLGLRCRQPRNAMADERRCCRLQQKRIFGIGKLCQRGNQICPTGALNHRLVTGKLSIQS
jgi:hypothetical protein